MAGTIGDGDEAEEGLVWPWAKEDETVLPMRQEQARGHSLVGLADDEDQL